MRRGVENSSKKPESLCVGVCTMLEKKSEETKGHVPLSLFSRPLRLLTQVILTP